jgi:Flp pilus assembly protein TadD
VEAESEFRAVLDISPTDDYAHYALGRCLERQGRAKEARGHYKIATCLSPSSERYASSLRDVS